MIDLCTVCVASLELAGVYTLSELDCQAIIPEIITYNPIMCKKHI